MLLPPPLVALGVLEALGAVELDGDDARDALPLLVPPSVTSAAKIGVVGASSEDGDTDANASTDEDEDDDDDEDDEDDDTIEGEGIDGTVYDDEDEDEKDDEEDDEVSATSSSSMRS